MKEMTRRDFLKTAGILGGTGLLAMTLPSCNLSVKKEFYDLEYESNGEKREVKVGVWYPKEFSELGLVGFSHGYFASPILYNKYLSDVASQGNLVVAPFHRDYINFLGGGGIIGAIENFRQIIPDIQNMLAQIQKVPGYEGISLEGLRNLFFEQGFAGEIENQNILGIFRDNFQPRIEEFKAGLDFVEYLNRDLSWRVDTSSPVFIGHSFGGYTCIETILENNRNIGGAIMMSPVSGLSDISQIDVPTRWMTGSLDTLFEPTKKGYEEVEGESSFLDIKGAGHLSFCEGAIEVVRLLQRFSKNSDLDLNVLDEIEKMSEKSNKQLNFLTPENVDSIENADERLQLIRDASRCFMDYCGGAGDGKRFLEINGNYNFINEFSEKR